MAGSLGIGREPGDEDANADGDGGTVRIAAGAEVAVSGQLSVGGPGARLVNAGTLALKAEPTAATQHTTLSWLPLKLLCKLSGSLPWDRAARSA